MSRAGRRQATRVAKATRQLPAARLEIATITAVGSGEVSVDLGRGVVDGVSFLDVFSPVVGQVVLLALLDDGDQVVLGPLA